MNQVRKDRQGTLELARLAEVEDRDKDIVLRVILCHIDTVRQQEGELGGSCLVSVAKLREMGATQTG